MQRKVTFLTQSGKKKDKASFSNATGSVFRSSFGQKSGLDFVFVRNIKKCPMYMSKKLAKSLE
jgi:hypothetical protein